MNRISQYVTENQKVEEYGWIIPVAVLALGIIYTLCNDAMDKNYALKINFKEWTLDLKPNVTE